MVVDHEFQKLRYNIQHLLSCPFPAVKLKHNFDDHLLSWDEIINNVNKQLLNNSGTRYLERETVNYQIKNVNLKKLQPLVNFLKKTFPEQTIDVDIYGSYENSAGGFKLHTDVESTILHVQKGEVVINVVTGSVSYVYNMKENDMIYIKKGIHHAVIGLTPRFLTSYGIHY